MQFSVILKINQVFSELQLTSTHKKSASLMRRIRLLNSFYLPDDFPVGYFTGLINFKDINSIT